MNLEERTMARTVIICSAMLIAFLTYLDAQAQPARSAVAPSRLQFVEAGTLLTIEIEVPGWGGPAVDAEATFVVHDADAVSVGDAQLTRLFGLPLWVVQRWEYRFDGDMVTPQLVTYGLLSTDGFDLVGATLADRRGRSAAVELLLGVTGQQLDEVLHGASLPLLRTFEHDHPARGPVNHR